MKEIKCIIVDDEHIARDVLVHHLEKIAFVEVILTCKNAVEAFNAINNHEVDLIFLDINMPEISGLSFAKSINKNIKIIFTTAYREYAVEGFDLKAVDYLLKPISFERLLQAIQKFKDEKEKSVSIKSEHNNQEIFQDFMFVRSDRKMVKVRFSQIRYVESLSDYLKIKTEDKTIIIRETISKIEQKLPVNKFIRIHRSFIVGVSFIESFTNEYVEIEKKAIPISRGYKKDVLQRLENM